MLKKLLTTAAAGALLMGASVAVAQDSGNATSGTTTTQTDTTGTATSSGTATTGGMSAPGTYLTEQSMDQLSANTYIGQTVYNANNESIGDINDLIIQKDGGVVAAVIGVGGFLGIGEKWVAVPMDAISVSQDAAGGDMKLMTTETADSLRAAPEFKTLDMKNVGSTMDGTAPATTTDGTTTTAPAPDGTTTAPAAPVAPAAPETTP